MLVSYLSPLAPAVVLLLGAFILSILFSRLPERWQVRRELKAVVPPGLVGLAILALLGTRLTLGTDPAGEGLELLSGWNFSTAESVAALTVRADGISLSFLILTLLVLLAVTLLASTSSPRHTPHQMKGKDLPGEKRGRTISGWLVMGAAVSLLFVSGNGLTISYALFLFDLLTVLYWLSRGQINLGVARLFLGLFTAAGLALATVNLTTGPLLLGIGLWLRLGLYPLLETVVPVDEDDYGFVVYLALSLTAGMYLVTRAWVAPFPEAGQWLTVFTMFLSGVSVWLTGDRPVILVRLVVTEALLLLLAGSLAEALVMTYAMGLILSMVALWITPRLGKPELSERAWLWPYFPALGATLTLLGIPFSLGWPVHPVVYQSFLALDRFFVVVLLIFAEGAALSGLVRYWLMLWRGLDSEGRQAAAGVVIMVPFLIPGLAPFVLFGLTQTEVPATVLEQPVTVFAAIAAVIALAFTLAFFRPQIMSRLNVSPTALAQGFRLTGTWLQESAGWGSKMVLRTELFLQGQHYVGWALFTALVGVLIILLGT